MSGRFRMIALGAALTLIIGNGDLAAQSGPPLRIGHYSTGNGLIGFVIDRMGTPIKLRFDGSDEILALKKIRGAMSIAPLTRRRWPRERFSRGKDDDDEGDCFGQGQQGF